MGGDKTYLDKYNTPEEKTKAILDNLYHLMKYKGYTYKELETAAGLQRSYLPYSKSTGTIELSRLLKFCDVLGVSLNKLMTFSYANVAKKAEIDAKEAKAKELKSELAKLEMQIKLDKQSLNEAYQKG